MSIKHAPFTQASGGMQTGTRRANEAHRMIGELLLQLGVTPHLVGFDALCGGIRMTAEQDRTGVPRSSEMQGTIETLCDAANGEHAIRDAISVCFSERNELHAEMFPFSDRPTNTEFVCTLAELVRNRIAPL